MKKIYVLLSFVLGDIIFVNGENINLQQKNSTLNVLSTQSPCPFLSFSHTESNFSINTEISQLINIYTGNTILFDNIILPKVFILHNNTNLKSLFNTPSKLSCNILDFNTNSATIDSIHLYKTNISYSNNLMIQNSTLTETSFSNIQNLIINNSLLQNSNITTENNLELFDIKIFDSKLNTHNNLYIKNCKLNNSTLNFNGYTFKAENTEFQKSFCDITADNIDISSGIFINSNISFSGNQITDKQLIASISNNTFNQNNIITLNDLEKISFLKVNNFLISNIITNTNYLYEVHFYDIENFHIYQFDNQNNNISFHLYSPQNININLPHTSKITTLSISANKIYFQSIPQINLNLLKESNIYMYKNFDIQYLNSKSNYNIELLDHNINGILSNFSAINEIKGYYSYFLNYSNNLTLYNNFNFNICKISYFNEVHIKNGKFTIDKLKYVNKLFIESCDVLISLIFATQNIYFTSANGYLKTSSLPNNINIFIQNADKNSCFINLFDHEATYITLHIANTISTKFTFLQASNINDVHINIAEDSHDYFYTETLNNCINIIPRLNNTFFNNESIINDIESLGSEDTDFNNNIEDIPNNINNNLYQNIKLPSYKSYDTKFSNNRQKMLFNKRGSLPFEFVTNPIKKTENVKIANTNSTDLSSPNITDTSNIQPNNIKPVEIVQNNLNTNTVETVCDNLENTNNIEVVQNELPQVNNQSNIKNIFHMMAFRDLPNNIAIFGNYYDFINAGIYCKYSFVAATLEYSFSNKSILGMLNLFYQFKNFRPSLCYMYAEHHYGDISLDIFTPKLNVALNHVTLGILLAKKQNFEWKNFHILATFLTTATKFDFYIQGGIFSSMPTIKIHICNLIFSKKFNMSFSLTCSYSQAFIIIPQLSCKYLF